MISDELLRDSAVDFEALVREELIASIGACLDEFMELLQPRTILGRVDGVQVPFNVSVQLNRNK